MSIQTTINVETSSGDAWIDLHQVVAVVCHLPNRDNFNVDIHVCGGTIFTVRDTDKKTYESIVSKWKSAKHYLQHEVAVSFNEGITVRQQKPPWDKEFVS